MMMTMMIMTRWVIKWQGLLFEKKWSVLDCGLALQKVALLIGSSRAAARKKKILHYYPQEI